MLLDVHPEPEDSYVEVHTPSRVLLAGRPDQSLYNREVLEIRAELEAVIRTGYFVREESVVFDVYDEFEDVEDWLEYAGAAESGLTLTPELIARARELLDSTGGRLFVRERVLASRLRRA